MTKKELRVQMKARNQAMPDDQRRAAAERIFGQVERLGAFDRARCVACFCSLPDEPDTRETLEEWSRSRRVVVPRVEGERMQFYDYRPLELVTGSFGIAEPCAATRVCDPAQIDLVVVPGVAFSDDGARLGRGKGFYDRYLSQPDFRGVKVGVCYVHQMVAVLPVEPQDVAMDCVCRG